MVFTQLPDEDKEAFFGLLDEYFSSRPDLFSNGGSPGNRATATAGAGASAGAAVQRALASNPEATAHLISAGLRHGVPSSSPYASAASNPQVANAVGRVAAASLAFNAGRPGGPPQPSLPRRSPGSPASAGPSPPPQPPAPAPRASAAAPGLVSGRKFGDVDTSSARNLFGSLRGATAAKNAGPPAVAPPVPSAFPKKANTFQPPPVRRAPSSATPAPPSPQEEAEAEEEEQEAGEWAEALYEYTSADPGDLQLQERQRVKVVEKTSDDWWTGEVDGKRGLFPASYVKLL